MKPLSTPAAAGFIEPGGTAPSPPDPPRSASGVNPAAARSLRPSGRRVLLTLVWIALKLTLIAALVNRNAADFVYAGF